MWLKPSCHVSWHGREAPEMAVSRVMSWQGREAPEMVVSRHNFMTRTRSARVLCVMCKRRWREVPVINVSHVKSTHTHVYTWVISTSRYISLHVTHWSQAPCTMCFYTLLFRHGCLAPMSWHWFIEKCWMWLKPPCHVSDTKRRFLRCAGGA